MKKKKKLLFLALAVVLCFSLAMCGEKEPFITLDSTEITVDADGVFTITGTAETGTTLEVCETTPTMNYGDDNTFTASVQMNDPVDQAVLTATYMTDTLEFDLTFDTTAYVEALDAAQAQKEAEQAAAQAQKEETAALKALEGTPLTEAMDVIQKYGYTATYPDSDEDFTTSIGDTTDLYTVNTLEVDADQKVVKVNLIAPGLEALEGQTLTEAMDVIQEYGYTTTYFSGDEDLTDSIEDVRDLYTVDTSEVDIPNKTVKVNLKEIPHTEPEISEEEAEDESSEVIVYYTDTGSKYHTSGCRTLSKSKYETTLSEAKAMGLEPCGVCNPPV